VLSLLPLVSATPVLTRPRQEPQGGVGASGPQAQASTATMTAAGGTPMLASPIGSRFESPTVKAPTVAASSPASRVGTRDPFASSS